MVTVEPEGWNVFCVVVGFTVVVHLSASATAVLQ
jgi:hypothetical protein